jgi:hypothetical protein
MICKRPLFLCIAAAAVVALVRCGSSAPPTAVPTPLPTIAPTPTPPPTPAPLVCSPTPPPLHGIRVSVHQDFGFRKTLDSKPVVENVDRYCPTVVGITGAYCFTRAEDDPQKADCDRMAMGVAADTGRYGPRWFYNDLPCMGGGDQPGCNNHPDNQFLVIAKGDGRFAACASKSVPIAGDRCGECVIVGGSSVCQ